MDHTFHCLSFTMSNSDLNNIVGTARWIQALMLVCLVMMVMCLCLQCFITRMSHCQHVHGDLEPPQVPERLPLAPMQLDAKSDHDDWLNPLDASHWLPDSPPSYRESLACGNNSSQPEQCPDSFFRCHETLNSLADEFYGEDSHLLDHTYSLGAGARCRSSDTSLSSSQAGDNVVEQSVILTSRVVSSSDRTGSQVFNKTAGVGHQC